MIFPHLQHCFVGHLDRHPPKLSFSENIRWAILFQFDLYYDDEELIRLRISDRHGSPATSHKSTPSPRTALARGKITLLKGHSSQENIALRTRPIQAITSLEDLLQKFKYTP